MSLKILQEGLTENPHRSQCQLLPLTQRHKALLRVRGGGTLGAFFIYTIRVSPLYWQPLSLRVVGRENRAKC